MKERNNYHIIISKLTNQASQAPNHKWFTSRNNNPGKILEKKPNLTKFTWTPNETIHKKNPAYIEAPRIEKLDVPRSDPARIQVGNSAVEVSRKGWRFQNCKEVQG